MLTFILLSFAFRIAMLFVSKRHEKRLRAEGAIEVGARNSSILATTHVLFYVAGAAEWLLSNGTFDNLSLIGILIYSFGATMLLVVVGLLGPLWTVKIMIAANHMLVRHWLFRTVRHPNYFLNILPELVGYAVALHAFRTLAFGLPIYAVPLAVRILQENRAMRAAGLTFG